MINQQIYIIVSDNTGARILICMSTVGKSFSTSGKIIIAVVKESLSSINMYRSEIVLAILVRIIQSYQRVNGSRIYFDKNTIVIINKEGNPRGNRIFGQIANKFRYQNFIKILSLASEIILYFL